MTLTSRRVSAGAMIAFTLLAIATLLLGNQRQVHAEGLAQQIICKIFTQLNEVSRGATVTFPPFRPGCGQRGGIEVNKIVVGGTAVSGDFSIHVKNSSGADIDQSPQPGVTIGRVYGNVPVGSYTISESGGPSDYTPTYSGDCNSSGAMSVSTGQLSTCTITNTFGTSAPAACSNGTDDDGDSFTDANDPNCHSDGNPSNASSYTPNATSEAGSLPACWNNVDDDGDGVKDFPADTGCTSATDTDETNSAQPPSTTQCSDGIDNDADTKIDAADPACHTDFNATNSASYNAALNNEAASAPVSPACSDGLDNDGDGLTDLADPGCNNASDTDETNAPVAPPSGGGSSGGGGGGGGISNLVIQGPAGFVGSVLGTSTAPVVKAGESCDRYLTAFIKSGGNNDPEQVKRLQYVFRDFEGFSSVQVNGVYDAITLAAVHAFQTKYAAKILTPWGISQSTGYTYLTTRKTINEIYCKNTKQFPLTPAEQQTIERVRTGASMPTSLTPSPSAPKTTTTAEGVGTSDVETSGNASDLWQRVLDMFR